MKRHIVLIAGMHRSGTSALTRLINLFGAGLASDLLPAKSDNVKGFWESRRIVDIHDAFLHAVGSAWDDVAPLPADAFTSPAAAVAQQGLVAALAEFDEQALAVVKDPRLCRLLPLWHVPLAECGFTPLVALIWRQPMEVAGSLKTRNHFAIEKGLVLWLIHILEAEFHSRGMKRVFVSYDAVLAEWRATAAAMSQAWKLQWPVDLDDVADTVAAFLDADLRHQQGDELSGPAPLRQMVDELMALLGGGNAAPTKLVKNFDRLRLDLHRTTSLFGPILSAQRETIFELGRSVAAHTEENGRLATLFDQSQTHVRNIEADLVKLNAALHAKEAELQAAVAAAQQHEAALEQTSQILKISQQNRSDLELRLAEDEVKLIESEASRDVLRAAVSDLSTRIEVAQLALNHAEARIVIAERQSASQELGLKHNSRLLEAERDAHRRLAEAHAALQLSCQEQVARLDGQAAELQLLQQELAQSRADAGEKAGQIEQLSAEMADLMQRNTGLNSDLAALEQRHAAVEERLRDMEKQRDGLIAERDGLAQARDALIGERSDLIEVRAALNQALGDLTQQRDALLQDRSNLTQERNNLMLERDRLAQLQRQLDGQLAELQRTYQALQQDHERVGHANARLIDQVAHLNADITASHDKCLLLEDTLRQIEQSRSWRVTAPLRKVGGALRGK